MTETILTECWLLAASILDIRSRRLPVWMGICAGGKVCLAVFMLSLLLISLFSGILLALRRVGRNTRLPYLPFLCAAWLLGQAFLF